MSLVGLIDPLCGVTWLGAGRGGGLALVTLSRQDAMKAANDSSSCGCPSASFQWPPAACRLVKDEPQRCPLSLGRASGAFFLACRVRNSAWADVLCQDHGLPPTGIGGGLADPFSEGGCGGAVANLLDPMCPRFLAHFSASASSCP